MFDINHCSLWYWFIGLSNKDKEHIDGSQSPPTPEPEDIEFNARAIELLRWV